jgi:hypothetical protein
MKPSAWIDKHGLIDSGWDAILDPDGWTPLYAIPPGYAVVPIEPTEKMKEAAMVTYIEAKLANWGMWKAMVAAAQEQKT